MRISDWSSDVCSSDLPFRKDFRRLFFCARDQGCTRRAPSYERMPVRSALYPMLALGWACTAGIGPACGQETLPGGDSEDFRMRMTAWSAHETEPVLNMPSKTAKPAAMPKI